MHTLDRVSLSQAHLVFLKEAAPLVSLGSRDFYELARGTGWSLFAAAHNIDMDLIRFIPTLPEIGSMRSSMPLIYRPVRRLKDPKSRVWIAYKIRYIATPENAVGRIEKAEDIERIARGCVEWGGIGCLAYYYPAPRGWMRGETLHTMAREMIGSQAPRPLIEVKLRRTVKTLVDVQDSLALAWEEARGSQQENAMWKGIYVKPSAASAIAAADIATSCRLYAEQAEGFGINVVPAFYYAAVHQSYKEDVMINTSLAKNPRIMPWQTWGAILEAIARQRGASAAMEAASGTHRKGYTDIREFNRIACMALHQHAMDEASGHGGSTISLVELAAAKLAWSMISQGLWIPAPRDPEDKHSGWRWRLPEVLARIGDQLHRIDVGESIMVYISEYQKLHGIYKALTEISTKYEMVMNNPFLGTCERYTKACYYPADLIRKHADTWQEMKSDIAEKLRNKKEEIEEKICRKLGYKPCHIF